MRGNGFHGGMTPVLFLFHLALREGVYLYLGGSYIFDGCFGGRASFYKQRTAAHHTDFEKEEFYMERDSTIFYKSFYEAANSFRDGKRSSDKIRLEFYDALFDYAFAGVEAQAQLSQAAGALFALVKPQIEANNKKYLIGIKGGRPRGKSPDTKAETTGYENEKPEVIEINENKKPNVKMNNVNNKNENENFNHENAAPGGAEIKKVFGKYKNVLLTDRELDGLREKFGSECEPWIERFSEGLELKGYKYNSHYLAILKWAEKAGTAKNGKREPSYDISDFEKIINSL